MAHKMETYASQGKRKALIDTGQQFHEELFSHCTNSQVVIFTKNYIETGKRIVEQEAGV